MIDQISQKEGQMANLQLAKFGIDLQEKNFTSREVWENDLKLLHEAGRIPIAKFTRCPLSFGQGNDKMLDVYLLSTELLKGLKLPDPGQEKVLLAQDFAKANGIEAGDQVEIYGHVYTISHLIQAPYLRNSVILSSNQTKDSFISESKSFDSYLKNNHLETLSPEFHNCTLMASANNKVVNYRPSLFLERSRVNLQVFIGLFVFLSLLSLSSYFSMKVSILLGERNNLHIRKRFGLRLADFILENLIENVSILLSALLLSRTIIWLGTNFQHGNIFVEIQFIVLSMFLIIIMTILESTIMFGVKKR